MPSVDWEDRPPTIVPLNQVDNRGSSRLETQSLWPIPRPEVFHGLVGNVCSVLDSATEADALAILVQFIIAFGSALNRSAHYLVEGTKHSTNLFGLIVGATAKGRKGTAWDRVAEIMAAADDTWAKDRVVSGLSSGEGLAHAVRDATTKMVRNKE